MPFTVATAYILTEANVVAAKVIDTQGGFAIQIQFDENGTWTLEQYSASNPGKHFVIFGQWGKKIADGRWLAAPLITRRIANGALVFTPDASREEADKLVLGLTRPSRKSTRDSSNEFSSCPQNRLYCRNIFVLLPGDLRTIAIPIPHSQSLFV